MVIFNALFLCGNCGQCRELGQAKKSELFVLKVKKRRPIERLRLHFLLICYIFG
ncbi:hypothetical protein SHEWT2_02774 [Shewanella hafniensis]|nr:hypothetical protein SHEWT2_02774 [Shewanella hafniensis]